MDGGYQRGIVPRVVVKYSSGKKEKWEVEGLHRFYQSQLSLLEGSFSNTENCSIGGRHVRTPENEFPRRLSRISSDHLGARVSREDLLHIS